VSLFRPLINLVILAVYLVRKSLFLIARVWGSIPGILGSCFLMILYIETHRDAPFLFYLPLGLGFSCRSLYPKLQVARPRFLQAPAKSLPPPPSASTAKGRADDPSEATVIGRLDPKLRELLRQKPDASAS